jgi:MazG family protein
MDSIHELLQIMARLRDLERGCEWDCAQNFASIAPHTLEEAYEVADAIARDDRAALKDELGDLLLQVVFHARMAEEEGSFDFAAVAAAISAKLIRRHPHIFGEAAYANLAEQNAAWERIKAAERQQQGDISALDGIPLALPALSRAAKLQKRAARVGFDWPELAPVLDKLDEELQELRRAVAERHAAAVRDELGDVLFTCVNLARHLGENPETALQDSNRKFERRFRRLEQHLHSANRQPEQLSLAELDAIWKQVKHEEGLA